MAAATGQPSAVASSPAPAAKPDLQAVDELAARIAERDSLDDATRARLAQDLRQTDPSLWPALMQAFQAALAYQRQIKEEPTASGTGPSRVSPEARPQGTAAASGPPVHPNPSPAQDTGTAQPVAATNLGTVQSAPLPPGAVAQPPSLLPSHPRMQVAEAPSTSLAQSERPVAVASEGAISRTKPEVRTESPEPQHPSGDVSGAAGVVAASYVAPAGGNADPWPERLDGAIKALESETRQSPQTSAELARQARLRLLYLAGGRREDAMRPIPSASPAMQDCWSQMIYGLATWMDTERVPDASRRAAEARQQLVAAANRLGELAPLSVRNASFAKEVKSYGDITAFDKTEFSPGQEVLLYAELENFKSEETPRGFHTQFRGSYEIFDARGQRVTAQELGKTEEYCRNHRRDFFLVYNFRLPKRIYGGRHTLQLTVEDLHGQKIGQSSLEFSVKASGE